MRQPLLPLRASCFRIRPARRRLLLIRQAAQAAVPAPPLAAFPLTPRAIPDLSAPSSPPTMTESPAIDNDRPSEAVVQPVLSPSNKRSPTGMHKELLLDDKRLASRLLQSRVGRDKQRYDGHTRLLACIVVSRRQRGAAADEFLLISSSKHPTQWILPKGGWESDESAVECALREADEEAGVTGDIVGQLGTLDFASQQGKPCRFYGFKLAATQVFLDWAENTRQRKWVSLKEARELLQHRSELVEMVSRAAAL